MSSIIPIIITLLSSTRFQYAQSSSVAGTETLLGITGRNFIILGADSSTTSNIALTASNLDKIFVVTDPLTTPILPQTDGRSNDNDNKRQTSRRRQQRQQQRRQHAIVAAAAGDSADADKLLNLLSAHATVREYEAGVGCDVECVFDGGRFVSTRDDDDDDDDDAAAGVVSPAGLDAAGVANLARGEISSSLRSRAPLRVCLLVAGMVRCDDDDYDRSDEDDIGAAAVTVDLDLDEWDGSSSVVVDEEESSSFSRRIQMQVEAAMEDFTSRKTKERKTIETETVVTTKQPPTAGLRPRLFWLDDYGSLQNVDYGAHGFAANFALSILDQGYRVDMTKEEAVELMRDCFEQLRERYVINSPRPPCIKCVDADGCSVVV